MTDFTHSDAFRERFKSLWLQIQEMPKISQQVSELARQILTEEGKTSPEATMSGTEVYDCLQRRLDEIGSPEENIQKNTFVQYLSLAARTKGTRIFCDGRRQGYYTQEEDEVANEELEIGEDGTATKSGEDGGLENEGQLEEGEATSSCEADLYPILRDWLFSKGHVASIIGNKRKNKTWGNPDVLGLKPLDFLGRFDVEITTVECKKSRHGWRQQFFEAVAHTRFSDRTYFAFAAPVDEIDKEAEELFQYAEFFGVGLVVLELPRQEYVAFMRGESVNVGKAVPRELYVAPCHVPQPRAKIHFLEGLGVRSISDLVKYNGSAQN